MQGRQLLRQTSALGGWGCGGSPRNLHPHARSPRLEVFWFSLGTGNWRLELFGYRRNARSRGDYEPSLAAPSTVDPDEFKLSPDPEDYWKGVRNVRSNRIAGLPEREPLVRRQSKRVSLVTPTLFNASESEDDFMDRFRGVRKI